MKVSSWRPAAAGLTIALAMGASADLLGKNKAAPAWSGKTVAGKAISSKTLKGKVVLMNFFSYT
jgi:hypothetical protein